MWERFEARRWDDAAAELHEEFVCEWPATGERFEGPENFIAMNRAYPDINWHIEVQRVIAAGDVVAAEVRVPHDHGIDWCTGFYELRDGKVWRATEYWTEQEPGPPPEWRAPWRSE